MKTVKYGSRIKGRFYLILFIRLELDKILKSGNKAKYSKNPNMEKDNIINEIANIRHCTLDESKNIINHMKEL